MDFIIRGIVLGYIVIKLLEPQPPKQPVWRLYGDPASPTVGYRYIEQVGGLVLYYDSVDLTRLPTSSYALVRIHQGGTLAQTMPQPLSS